jgi:gamma-glutamyltranspeptidase/glutathione hydrolase
MASVGAVAAPHWRANEAGRAVLDRGGSSTDACIAMAAMLSVVYPHMCGIGGDLFALFFDAGTGTVQCLDASGRAPRGATISAFRERGHATVPAKGPLPVTVPGAVDGWTEAHERFGIIGLGELLEPAIEAAEGGFEVTPKLARWIDGTREELESDPTLKRRLAPARSGDQVSLPELASSLRLVAAEGRAAFYHGPIADEIDRASREAAGFLRREDLESHRSDWVEPLRVPYHDVEVLTTPPPSQGITALLILNRMAAETSDRLAVGSAPWIDRFVAAKRTAFANRDRFVSDPAFVDVPVSDLLSAAKHLDEPDRNEAVTAGPPSGDTVYVCAVDAAGNACSLIQSIYYGFGSGFVAGNTGILLHNRGHYFSLDEDHPNALEPGKKTLHTLMASLALRDGRPWLVFGTMGADGQPQTTVQVLSRALAGADAQAAVSAPRVLAGRFLVEDDEERLLTESDLGAETISELRMLDHDVEPVPPRDERMGHAQAILVREDGMCQAGLDPRGDGFPNPV